jgi:hypothetical protein
MQEANSTRIDIKHPILAFLQIDGSIFGINFWREKEQDGINEKGGKTAI